MAATKRKALTTDDLMRMQEDGPSRKRARQILLDSDDSEAELLQVPTTFGSEGENEESDDEGSVSGSDLEDVKEEDENENDEDVTLPTKLRLPMEADADSDDAGTSRVSSMPRKSFQAVQKPLTASPIRQSSFEALGIAPSLLVALAKMSIRLPTDIQAACIPPLLQGESSVYR